MPNSTKTTKTASEMRLVLGKNVKALMDIKYAREPNRPKALADDAGPSFSTIQRVISGQIGASIDTIAQIAKALDVVPYQLLIRHLDPDNPQVAHEAGPRERDQYRRLKKPAPTS